MNIREFCESLQLAVENSEELEDQKPQVNSFEDAGLMTRNKGIVVYLEDGSEFQVTVVQSVVGESDDEEDDEEEEV